MLAIKIHKRLGPQLTKYLIAIEKVGRPLITFEQIIILSKAIINEIDLFKKKRLIDIV